MNFSDDLGQSLPSLNQKYLGISLRTIRGPGSAAEAVEGMVLPIPQGSGQRLIGYFVRFQGNQKASRDCGFPENGVQGNPPVALENGPSFLASMIGKTRKLEFTRDFCKIDIVIL